MLIILLGAPGVGKGTQAKLLAKRYNLSVLSTGEILRNAVKQKTVLGDNVSDIINRGALVPDDIVCVLIRNAFNEKSTDNGFLLDGFPRTVKQAVELSVMVNDYSFKEPCIIILLSLTEEEIIKRLSARIFCKNCHHSYNLITNPTKVNGRCDICFYEKFYTREDDKKDAVKVRLSRYVNDTKPLIEHYKSYKNYIEVDADKDIKEINKKIISFIELM